jgi:hypothetical protein
MSYVRYQLCVLSVLLLVLGLASCHGFFTDPVLSSINVTPSSPSVVVNGTQQFTAIGVNDDGSTKTLNSVTWASDTPATATIYTNGLAKAVAAGTSKITATSGSISGSTTMTVTTSALQSIAVTASGSQIMSGGTLQFTAKATYQDGSTKDITSSATWVSSNTGVATISTSGLASGVATGTTNITAALGNVTSQGFTLTVF